MAQLAKIDAQLDIKSSAEGFYEIFRSKHYLLPKICPDLIKGVQVIKGDWESVGSIKQWTYVAGNSETSKEMVVAKDDENKTITSKALDGDITKYYKDFSCTVQVSGKGGEKGCSVKFTLKYEKLNDDLPAPTKYLDFSAVIAKKIEAYLNNNNIA